MVEALILVTAVGGLELLKQLDRKEHKASHMRRSLRGAQGHTLILECLHETQPAG